MTGIGRTHSKFFSLHPTGFTPAFLEFPTVHSLFFRQPHFQILPLLPDDSELSGDIFFIVRFLLLEIQNQQPISFSGTGFPLTLLRYHA
jgi:hypothetical protein